MADPVHGDRTDDAARWWQAYQLAENDQVDELRRLAAAGDDHARRQLPCLALRASVGLASNIDDVERFLACR